MENRRLLPPDTQAEIITHQLFTAWDSAPEEGKDKFGIKGGGHINIVGRNILSTAPDVMVGVGRRILEHEDPRLRQWIRFILAELQGPGSQVYIEELVALALDDANPLVVDFALSTLDPKRTNLRFLKDHGVGRLDRIKSRVNAYGILNGKDSFRSAALDFYFKERWADHIEAKLLRKVIKDRDI